MATHRFTKLNMNLVHTRELTCLSGQGKTLIKLNIISMALSLIPYLTGNGHFYFSISPLFPLELAIREADEKRKGTVWSIRAVLYINFEIHIHVV